MRRKDRAFSEPSLIRDVLDRADSCVLGLSDGNEPYLVSLNYGYEWEGKLPRIYFHCATEGRKLGIIKGNPRACLCLSVDRVLRPGQAACDFGMDYKSLVGHGALSVLSDPADKRRCLDAIMRKYSGQGQWDYNEAAFAHTLCLCLILESLEGKARGAMPST